MPQHREYKNEHKNIKESNCSHFRNIDHRQRMYIRSGCHLETDPVVVAGARWSMPDVLGEAGVWRHAAVPLVDGFGVQLVAVEVVLVYGVKWKSV